MPLTKKILFSFIVVVLFFSSVEIGLRIIGFPHVRIIDEVKAWQETCEWSKLFKFNNLGLRGSRNITPKVENIYRIVCIGDSWTFGLNVPEEKSYPALLGDYLKNEFKKNIEVINAGYPGYTIQDIHQLLLKYIEILNPDCIIFLGGSNGILHEEDGDWDYNRFHSSGLGNILARTYFYNGLSTVLDTIKESLYRISKKAEEKKELDSFVFLLDNLQKKGIKIILLNYPAPVREKGIVYDFYQDDDNIDRFIQMCKNRNPEFTFINLSQLFHNINNPNDLFLKICAVHPNEKGYRFIAEYIAFNYFGDFKNR